MKKSMLLIITCTGALLSACSTSYRAGSAQDDVYYSAADDPAPAVAPAATANSSGASSNDNQYTPGGGSYQGGNNAGYDQSSQGNDAASSQSNNDYSQSSNNSSGYSDGNGNTYVTNNYYNGDDYYDYAYTARLRRFYSPYNGYSYYDPVYTNSYWYDYNPYNFGVSIYNGYSWWAPSYYYYSPFTYGGPHWGLSFGWGTPCYSSWYSPGFYSPWYGGYYSPYYSSYSMGYWNGYQQGYYNGSWGLANPYYYNSYDGNFHYGHRGSAVSDNSPRGGGSRDYGSHRNLQSVGSSYTEAVNSGRVIRSSDVNTTQPVRPASGISTKNPVTETPAGRPGRGETQEQTGRGSGTIASPMQETTPRGGRNTNYSSGTDRSNLNNSAPVRNNQGRSDENTRPNQSAPSNFGRPSDNDITPSRNNTTNPSNDNNNVRGGWSQPMRSGGRTNNDNDSRSIRRDERNNYRQDDMTPVRRNDDNRSLPESTPSRNSWNERNDRQPVQSAPSRQPSIREEQRTPTFQPRNEPRQFHQEAPSQAAPRNSSPSYSSPRNSSPSAAPSPGRRR